MNDDGGFKSAWDNIAVEAPNPNIAYGTQDIWFCAGVQKFVTSVLEAEDLNWFQSSAAGLEHPILKAFGEKADLYTSAHAQSESIAEWALWAGLDFFGGGPARRAAQTQGQWQQRVHREISSTNWLIIGFGEIGKATARKLRALGASVTGVRRTPGKDADADEIIHPRYLHSALPKADAVLLCCPITNETHSLANDAFFSAMKDDALLLNVGRGALVDDNALLAGLARGKPAHATLDVFTEEPLVEDHPFWAHPKVTVTPHLSAWTEASKRRTDEVFLKNLETFLSGTPAKMDNLIGPADFEEQIGA